MSDKLKREKTKREFSDAVDGALAVMYVALSKSGDSPAMCNTGGMKLTGVSPAELARGIGAIVGDLVGQMRPLLEQQGKNLKDDDILTVLMPMVVAGARNRLGIDQKGKGGNGQG